MSMWLKMPEESWRELAEEMVEEMKKKKAYKGKFEYKITLPKADRTAKIIFTTEAFAKMVSLIMVFDKEVGWYCTCQRKGELDDDEYLIDDVMVFPQTVTATTVDSDDEERTAWFDALPVETLLKIKCDCHSHVNMGTSPSGTDDKDMESIFDNLGSDGFRVFMIWNKRLEFFATIYDMQKNILFEKEDITVEVEGFDLKEFIDESKSMVSNKTYSAYTYPKANTAVVPNMRSTTSYNDTTKSKNTKKKVEEEEDEELDIIDYMVDDEFDDDDYGNWYHEDMRRYRKGYYGYGLY